MFFIILIQIAIFLNIIYGPPDCIPIIFNYINIIYMIFDMNS